MHKLHIELRINCKIYFPILSHHNLPFGGRAMRGSWVRLPRKENTRCRHQRLLEENVGKTKKTMVYMFWKWGFGSCLRTGKVLAPHTPVTRDDGLQLSVRIWLQNYVFSLFYVFMYFSLLCDFYVFYFFVVDKGVSLTPMYPRLQWGNQIYIVL